MPELPEVETVMRGLKSRLQGQRIISAVARRHDLRWPIPERLSEALMGTTVTGFRRRGKFERTVMMRSVKEIDGQTATGP